MPQYTPDGLTKVTWVLAIGDPDFPGVTELELGVDLECFLTKDGLNVTFNEQSVASGVLCEKFDRTRAGTFGLQAELKMYRHNEGDTADVDTAWNTFNHGDEGYLVVRRGVDLEDQPDYEAGDKVEVYVVESGNKRPSPTAGNENETFMVSFYGSAAPHLDAVVAAS